MGADKVGHGGDIFATLASFITVVSYWAGILSPILTVVVTVCALVWWYLRFRKLARGEARRHMRYDDEGDW